MFSSKDPLYAGVASYHFSQNYNAVLADCSNTAYHRPSGWITGIASARNLQQCSAA